MTADDAAWLVTGLAFGAIALGGLCGAVMFARDAFAASGWGGTVASGCGFLLALAVAALTSPIAVMAVGTSTGLIN